MALPYKNRVRATPGPTSCILAHFLTILILFDVHKKEKKSFYGDAPSVLKQRTFVGSPSDEMTG